MKRPASGEMKSFVDWSVLRKEIVQNLPEGVIDPATQEAASYEFGSHQPAALNLLGFIDTGSVSPYMLPVSSYNRLLEAAGEKQINLENDEAVFYLNPDFLEDEQEDTVALLDRIAENAQTSGNALISIDKKSVTLVPSVPMKGLTADENVKIVTALIVSDEIYHNYVDPDTCSVYWNFCIPNEIVEANGLMLSVMEARDLLKPSGLYYESYLDNFGRQLFYLISGSYMTLYMGLTISGNRWYRHSQSKGGYPVDFVMEFYYATFPEAVKMLIGEEGEGRQKSCPAPSKDFRLPEKNKDNEMIVKYLTESRELEKNLVMEWIVRGDIYEEKKHHNVVFIGRDADGIPRYAHCRGTGEMKYRGDVAGSDKAFGFCHRGTDNQLFVFEAAIDLLSFIQLFPKDWKKRSYLSLGGVSSVALMTFLSERPQITSVFLCLDNDQAGNEACEKLAGEISEGYSVIRLKPSRKDWNEILCDKNTDRKKAIAETITIKVPEAEELVPMLCYEDIKQTSVEWLWFPYIPFGKLTIIQGNPGEGKTYFAMMLTAACTNRKLFPNMEDIEPFNVIYQTAEDGMGDTIKPRLIEAGADLSRVMVIDDTEEALTLSDDRIEKAVRQNRVRLVIIDPVQAFIGADVDMNRANEVRPVFRKLGMIAEKTGCAIVLIGHLNKSSGTQSTYRGLGSIDIMAAVRSLIFIGKVRKDPTTRVLIHEKSSLAPPGETMAFKLGDEEGFRWVGAYEISADELLDGKEGKATETKLERGRKLIRELLADKKEISIRELDEKAKEQGISGRTMRDVRSRMKNELEYQVNEKQENSIRLKE